MIYDSPEIIPAKIYLKIIEGAPLTLLSTEPGAIMTDLVKAWKNIEDTYKRNETKDDLKTLDLSKRMERFAARLESVILSIHYLRQFKDDELINNLKNWQFTFNWKKETKYENEAAAEAIYQSDLDRIERESETIKHKIDRIFELMPKIDDDDDAVGLTFDENVLIYAAFTDLGYIDPNVLPLTQYDALISAGNKKMTALEKQAAKNKSRNKSSRNGKQK